MNEFLERIFDLIEEMAFPHKILEPKITGESKPIILHIIKILRYHDPLNYKKHILDIDSWILDIESLKAKVKITQQKYYKWMYLDWIDSDKDFNRFLKILNYRYHNLKIIRPDKEIYILLEKIMFIITYQISNKNFIDLETILKDLNIFDQEQYEYN